MELYNLFISGADEAWETNTTFFPTVRCIREYTDSDLVERFDSLGDNEIEELKKLPCIFAYENGHEKDASIGYITDVLKRNDQVRITFNKMNIIIPKKILESMDFELDIRGWELSRTHWAVKKADLFKELREKGILVNDTLQTCKQMRSNYCADWAFSISHSIEEIVQKNHPQELHSWPIIKVFNFEAYWWNNTHVIYILRDKLSGITTGPGEPQKSPNNLAPNQPPSKANLDLWWSYFLTEFTIRDQDVVMIIPALDSGGSDVQKDWLLWGEEDRELWSIQLNWNFMRQFYFKKGVKLMPDFYIPPGYQFLREECMAFFQDHPDYDKNVFIMTRFVPGNRLLESLDSELRRVLRQYGLNPLRADDKMYMRDRNLWNNVCTYMICCKYGIAILEDRVVNEFNPNVALEYGFMRALNKPALLLSDIGFRNLRADVLGTLRENFDIADIENSVQLPIQKWLRDLNIIK